MSNTTNQANNCLSENPSDVILLKFFLKSLYFLLSIILSCPPLRDDAFHILMRALTATSDKLEDFYKETDKLVAFLHFTYFCDKNVENLYSPNYHSCIRLAAVLFSGIACQDQGLCKTMNFVYKTYFPEDYNIYKLHPRIDDNFLQTLKKSEDTFDIRATYSLAILCNIADGKRELMDALSEIDSLIELTPECADRLRKTIHCVYFKDSPSLSFDPHKLYNKLANSNNSASAAKTLSDKDPQELEAALAKKEEEIAAAKQELTDKTRTSRNLKQQVKEFREKTHSLEQQVKDLQRQLQKTREQKEAKITAVPSEEAETSVIDIQALTAELQTKRILMVGGHPNWTGKMKNVFPDWKFLEPGATHYPRKDLKNFDMVFFFTEVLSHKSYNKFSDYIHKNQVPVGYVSAVNINYAIQEIYTALQKEGTLAP